MVAVVAAVLVHEYRAFPEKMAQRVSVDVATEVGKRVSRMHRDFAVGYASSAADAYVYSVGDLAGFVAARHGDSRLTENQLAELIEEYGLTQRSTE